MTIHNLRGRFPCPTTAPPRRLRCPRHPARGGKDKKCEDELRAK